MATNVCAETLESPAAPETVGESLAGLSACRHDFERFLGDLLGQWEDLRERIALLEREKGSLESQLEAAQRRAAALALELAAKKRPRRRAAAPWDLQMRQLRRMLKDISRRLPRDDSGDSRPWPARRILNPEKST